MCAHPLVIVFFDNFERICLDYSTFSSGIELRLVTAAADSILWLTRFPRNWIWVAADSIQWPTRVRAAGYVLRLSSVPATGSRLRPSRVPADGYKLWLQLTQVPAAGYRLRPTPSHPDLSSSSWIRVTADYILRLTRVLDATSGWFHPAADYKLQLILFCGWLESAGWTRLAADLYFNISSKFKDLFCKIYHFYGLFSTTWFQLPLILTLAAASSTSKKLEEAWRTLKKLQDLGCDWF